MVLESKYERQQRLKRQRYSGILGFVLAFALIVIIGVALWIGRQSLIEQNKEYEAQRVVLESKISEQKERSDKIDEYKKYIQTKKFAEEIAKSKFGLIYPDEIVIKPDS